MAKVDRLGLSGDDDDDDDDDDSGFSVSIALHDIACFFGFCGGGGGASDAPPPSLPSIASAGLPGTTQPNGAQGYLETTFYAITGSNGVSTGSWAIVDASHGLDNDGISAIPNALVSSALRNPTPGTPVNSQYVLVVENDSGGHTKDVNREALGRRIIEYDFRLQPVNTAEKLGGDPGNMKDIVISEHLSNPSVFGGAKYPERGVQFTDGIAPGLFTGGSTERYFTVALGGKNLGVVPILDRHGEHLVDRITMTPNPRTVILNGTLNRTDIP